MVDNDLLSSLSKTMMGEVESLKEMTKLKEILAKEMGIKQFDATKRSIQTWEL
tara:strand:- start:1484 stop:1642 length:159 start_codon:yes stop_codon:yes gene_type:complete